MFLFRQDANWGQNCSEVAIRLSQLSFKSIIFCYVACERKVWAPLCNVDIFAAKITSTKNLLNTANSNKNCISKTQLEAKPLGRFCFYLLTNLFDKIYSNIKAKYVLQNICWALLKKTSWSEVCTDKNILLFLLKVACFRKFDEIF